MMFALDRDQGAAGQPADRQHVLRAVPGSWPISRLGMRLRRADGAPCLAVAAWIPRPWPVSARFQAHSSGAGHSKAYRRQDREDQAMPKARICRAAAGAMISARLPGASWIDPERGAWWNI